MTSQPKKLPEEPASNSDGNKSGQTVKSPLFIKKLWDHWGFTPNLLKAMFK